MKTPALDTAHLRHSVQQARGAELSAQDPGALRAAAEQFEGLMMQQMMKSMRQTVPTEGGITEASFASKVYTDMLDEEYANVASKQGGLGLADLIVTQLGGEAAPSRGAGAKATPGLPPLALNARSGRPVGAWRPTAASTAAVSEADVAEVGVAEAGRPQITEGRDAAYTHKGQQMRLPVAGRLSSHFGPRRLGGGPQRAHKGMDIAAPTGRPIAAALPGRVAFSGTLNGYGKVVYLDHGDGLTTRYAHASALEVKAGDTVEAGQIIAKVGSTGRSTGPHLHFEVRRGGKAEDPRPWLGLDGAKGHVDHDHEDRPATAHEH